MATDENPIARLYNRTSDIVNEPIRMLMPIAGHEKMPLVSLEESVISLVDTLPRIQYYVSIAKKLCEPKPADGLTQDQSASIILYTMEWEPYTECLYVVLNSALRAENRGKLKPWFSYLKLILTALSRLPSSQRTVYRGVKKDLSEEYSIDKIFVWWGFSSSTLSVGVLNNEQFLGKAGERTLFTIKCFSGKDISQHSYFQKESEILLLPARQFQVTSRLQLSYRLHMIQLEEIKSDIPLLESGNHQS